MFWFVVFLVGVALLFDFLNGRNDAANSIATIVSTRVISPVLAVFWAAFFNFTAFFFMGVHVAKTVGKGIVDPHIITSYLIFAALIAAILWVFTCTKWGIPISVSHSLIGGLIGPALVIGGTKTLVMSGVIKVCVFIFLTPLLGMFVGLANMLVVYWGFRKWAPQKVDNLFRKLQLVSAAIFSISHGANDAQKTMGIIAILLFVNGYLGQTFYVPFWVIIACYTTIALGTISGGWRTVATMGTKITKLQPVSGFCAETAGGIVIMVMSALGIPVSTTHTIAGSIAGVGSARRISAVRWHIAGTIVWAWILTIPVTALIGALIYMLVSFIRGS